MIITSIVHVSTGTHLYSPCIRCFLMDKHRFPFLRLYILLLFVLLVLLKGVLEIQFSIHQRFHDVLTTKEMFCMDQTR